MNDNVVVGIVMTFFVVLFVGGLLMLGYFIGRAECNRIRSDSQISTEYRLIGGCYVEVNSRMIPLDNWRGEYELAQ